MAYHDIKTLQDVSALCDLFPDEVIRLEIAELGLPNLEADFEDFESAGMSGHTLQIGTGRLQAVEPTLKLVGNLDQLYKAFLTAANWTINGVVVNANTGEKTGYKMTYKGQLAKISPEARSGKSLHHHEYAFRGVMSYAISSNGQQLYAWTVKGGMKIAGVDVDAENRAILG
ncbi:Phage tail tube protein FII [Cohaesibacter sp. ES.047]|uniref:phage major tail tube protein n=1 Tax=Cohaesibacter sp. ES.047 TaxID=1798205 RepID=UPI000BB7F073|nr:phage major tail tube protein [Cohaesibacter sp. ES.047]SNY93432.1 Phage tail tube protein FII [Cohaesibacter sp. ES.047]